MRRARTLLAMLVLAALAWAWRAQESAPEAWPVVARPAGAPAQAGPAAPDTASTPAAAERAPAAVARAAQPGAGPLAAPEVPGNPASVKDAGERKPASAPPALTRAEARERMQDRRRLDDCASATAAVSERRLQELEAKEWRWLPEQQAAQEQLALRTVAARVRARCTQAELGGDAPEREAEIDAALAAGDLDARLRSLHRMRPRPDRAQVRALLYDVLLSGDLELIAELGLHLYWVRDPQSPPTTADLLPSAALWTLVACDLGAPCGPGSRALERLCLTRSPAACTAPGVEAALRELGPEWQWRLMQAPRAERVARIRSGRIPGLLDGPGGG